MRFQLSFPAVLAAVLVLGQAADVKAGVVFGNLGSSGTGALTNTNTDVGPTLDYRLAQGFTAAAPNLSVEYVSLGLFGDGSIPTTVGIFADNFGEPAASPVFTSASVTVGAKNTYTFSFSGANLTAGSSYWVYPMANVSWYTATPVPSGQNASGYVFTQTLENPGTGWASAPSNRYSIAVAATVPEPSTFILGMAGLGLAAVIRARRRKAVA